ncbi:MAG: hypothetical protein J5772_04245, partial [Clostridia bacterium]|nr:hypothetical protein [Clostridia bacterium]
MKKLIALLMAALMIISLAACKKAGGTDAQTAQDTETQAPEGPGGNPPDGAPPEGGPGGNPPDGTPPPGGPGGPGG